MKFSELDEVIVRLLEQSDHPEITSIERMATPQRPDYHTRVVVTFASGAAAYIMIKKVVAANGREHATFEVPKELV